MNEQSGEIVLRGLENGFNALDISYIDLL